MPNLQACGRTPAHSNANVHWHLVCHTVTNKPHHIFTSRHPHIWWMGHHKVAQWYQDGSWHIGGESCIQGQITWLNCTLIWKALQAGKYWDDMKGNTLKLCNENIHTYISHFMEIQQRDNGPLAFYVHCFKTEGKRCDFNSDTTTICIFVKGLWDSHSIIVKIYEKDPQTLSEVIKLVEKLNTAQQVTATLTPPTVNMMLNNDRCFLCSKTGHIGHHCPDVQCYSCDSFGHFTQDCSEKIPPSRTPCHHDR